MSRRSKLLGSVGLVAAMGGAAVGGLATGAFAGPTKPATPAVRTLATSPPLTTASFTFSASVSGLAGSLGTLSFTGTGEADFAAHAATVSVHLPPALASLLPGGSGSSPVLTAVLSGGTVYAQVPGLSSLVGRPWISVTLPSGAVSKIPGAFDRVASALGDVGDIVHFARAHHATVSPLGSSTVDGLRATGERITGHLAGVVLTATVWADGTGRLVRATVDAGASGNGLSATLTVDVGHYGVPVTVSVPPPDEVKAIPLSLVKQFLGGILGHFHLGKLAGL